MRKREMKPHPITNGFSLVEVMVGMTVGLIGMIVIFQVFSLSEGNKRTTTTGGDAMQNGSLALYNIERDVRMAGYGIGDPGYLGCNVDAYDVGPPVRNPFNFTLAPLIITQGANNDVAGDGTDPDTLTVMYGNSQDGVIGYELVTNVGPLDPYEMASQFGFTQANGELVVISEPGVDCTLAQITSAGTSGGSFLVQHGTGSYIDANGNAQPVVYNKNTGLGNSYTNNAKLFKLGNQPRNVQYSIVNNALSSYAIIQNITETVADGIVNMQALYGIDTGSDGIVDVWQATLGAATSSQVVAVRLALVARVGKREAGCTATTVPPAWMGGTFDLGADPDWQCYRYKIFQTTVPLRSMIWRAT